MIQYKITFNGTEEQFIAGAVGNGWRPEMPEEMHDFMARTLLYITPVQFIQRAVQYWEERKGKDNYNAEEMLNSMMSLINIEKI